MLHKMDLWDESFQKINDKTKTIEMRLCDEKRSLISVGDIIEFTNTKNGEILGCIVTNLYKYKNFDELYRHHDKISIGYAADEIADPRDMLTYYSAEKIETYGVLGIEVEIQPVIEELSAMAVVLYHNKILATNELIYGKETLSLPKGHKEENESIMDTAIRECFEETNIVITQTNFIKELESFSYDFLTPSNQLIRKTIVPFLFEVNDEGEPVAKEKRMISVHWMDKDEFLEKCTHDNVRNVVRTI